MASWFCRLLILLGLVLSQVACQSRIGAPLRAAGEVLGVVEPSAPSPRAVNAVVDPSPGSVTRAEVEPALNEMLAWFSRQSPGSELRLFGLRDDLAHSSSPVLVLVLPSPVMSGDRARRAMEQQFLGEARPKVALALDKIFAAMPRQSPIAEAVVAASVASRPADAIAQTVVFTDGRQEDALGRFECPTLFPTPLAWQSRLRKAGLFLPGQLANTRVLFGFFSPRPVDRDRCAVTMRDYLSLEELWRTVLVGSGATVSFHTGAISARDLE